MKIPLPGILRSFFCASLWKGFRFHLYCSLLVSIASFNLGLKAQVATNYVWSQSLQTYTAGISTTSQTPSDVVPTFWDDNTITTYKFPFNFTYNGTSYTAGTATVGVDSDGWIAFSTGTITMTGTTGGGSWVSIADHTGVYLNGTANNNGICGFNGDIQEQVFSTFTASGVSGSPTLTSVSDFSNIRVGLRLSGTGIADGTVVNAFNAAAQTITMSANATASGSTTITPRSAIYAFLRGIAPYRQFVIQWTRGSRYSVTTGDDFNFQVVLNEGGGISTYQTLQAVYGTLTTTNPVQNSQVGLKGNSPTDFNARTTTTNWSATTAAAANTATCSLSSTVFPISGLTYTWSPVCTIAATNAGAITGPTPVCPNSSQDYSIPGVPGAIFYIWTYTGGGTTLSGTTTLPLNTLNFGAAATGGTLTVTPGNLCGNGTSSSLVIAVNSVTSATISYPLATYCQSTVGTVSPTLTGTAGGTYTASPAGLSITSAGVITPSSSASGTYTVTYSFISGACSLTATTTIAISPNPIISVTATPSSVCSGGNSQLSAAADAGGNYTVAGIAYTSLAPTGSPTVLWSTAYVDDAVSGAIPIPFAFNYYGQNITQLYAYVNGYITLQTAYPAAFTAVQTLPNPATPNNLIALAWDDLEVDQTINPTAYVRYFVNGTAPNRVMVIDYNQLDFLFWGGVVTGQIRLYESDNHIEVAVTTVNDAGLGDVKTLGIENSLGTIAATPAGRNNVVWNVSSEAWSFTPKPVSYLWSPSTFLNSTIISNPVATGVTSTTVYNVKVTDIATGCFTNGTTTVTMATPLSGTYTVGGGGNYPTLTAAVNAYNGLCIGGPVVFSLIDPTYNASETFPISINSNVYQSAVNTLTIQPASGVNATISGSLASNALIRVTGKYISINGSNNNSTTRNLTITNTSTSSPTTVLFGSVGAVPVTNSSLKNCIITNGINSSSAVVISDAGTLGNAGYFSNDTIQNNIVQKAYIGIFSIAVNSAGNGNGLNILSNDLTASGTDALYIAGIYAQDIDGVTIKDNQVANLVGTDSYDDKGIWLATGVRNSSVLNNKITNLNYTGTFGYGAYGICITSGVTNANIRIANNMIANISGDGFNYTSASFALDNPTGIMLFTTQSGIEIYNNSIYLSGNTLNQTNAISTGIRLYTGSTADIRNNIIVNNLGLLSATGYAAIGILASTSNTQFTNLDFNDYVINPTGTISKYFGQISTTGQTTLPAWRTATGRDAASITVTPVFLSSTDLHLSPPASNLLLNNTGTPIAGLTTDYDNTTRNGLTPDIGADEFLAPNTGSWVGKTSIDWLVNTNWETNVIPDLTSDVSITGGYSFMPTIVTTQAVRKLNLSAPGAPPILTINAGILQVYDTIKRTGGTINAINGTMEMKGAMPQPIPANLFQSNNLKNLVISNTNNVTGVTLEGTLDIYRSMTYGAGGRKLTTGGFLTFKSTASETAWLGQMTASNIIVGDARVERYIPNHSKAWQFLAVPTSGQTINAAWQEGNTPLSNAINPGNGTLITNNTAGTGFDIIGGVGPSMKTYVPLSNSWLGIANTSIPITNQKGYMLFVRGDRSVTTTIAPATATNMRTKGTLYTPANPPPITNIGSTQFESVGNPYASAIDFSNDIGVSKSANVQKVFYVWDPKLGIPFTFGAYQTFTRGTLADNNYYISPGGGSYGVSGSVNTIIQSGQAFFVHTFGGTGNLTITETAKVNGSSNVNRVQSRQGKQLRTNLYVISGGNSVLVDGNLIEYDRTFSNGVDILDAIKLANSNENLGLARDGINLAVERRSPIVKKDTVFYKLGQLNIQQYQFEFIPNRLQEPGLQAWLEDNYLHSSTPVSLQDTTRLMFDVINVPGSYAPDRFRLVFRQKKHPAGNPSNGTDTNDHTITFTSGINSKEPGKTMIEIPEAFSKPGISVYPNPVIDKIMQVAFNDQPAGDYSITLINNSGQVVYKTNIQLAVVNKGIISLPIEGIIAGNYKLNIKSAKGNNTTLQVIIN